MSKVAAEVSAPSAVKGPSVGVRDGDSLHALSTRDRPPRIRVNRRLVALHAGVSGGFLIIAVLMWWRVWVTGHPASTITCQCGDVSEELGYLAWTPWAVAHGHSPFFSN